MNEGPIILFDGVCNLCNSVVKFVIRRDKRSRLRFAALQSTTGAALLARFHLSATSFDSFVLIDQGTVYTRSTAALRVTRYLSGAWPLLYGFIIVPRIVRNGVYRWIARNRYRWFGRTDQCMIPTPDTRQRFLS